MRKEELIKLVKNANCEIHIEQEQIDDKHMSSLWYGGHIASVYFPNGVVGDISADGEIRATLFDEDGNEVIDVVDKNSAGRFYKEMKDFVKSDEEMNKLADEGRLVFGNNNWFEITARDLNGNFIDLGWSAASDELYDAIGECLAGMPEVDGFNKGFLDKIKSSDIEEIRLLSVKEAESIPRWVRITNNGSWWWLCTPGEFMDYVGFVDKAGSVYSYGMRVGNNLGGVRPALKIKNLDSAGFEVGEELKVLNLKAQYIGNNSVLLCEPLDYRRYDEKSNVYKTSEVKRFLDDWLEARTGNSARRNRKVFDPRIQAVANHLGWSVKDYACKGGNVVLSHSLPSGELFSIIVHHETAAAEIRDYNDAFDLESDINERILAQKSKGNVPSVRQIKADSKAIQEFLKELAEAVTASEKEES